MKILRGTVGSICRTFSRAGVAADRAIRFADREAVVVEQGHAHEKWVDVVVLAGVGALQIDHGSLT